MPTKVSSVCRMLVSCGVLRGRPACPANLQLRLLLHRPHVPAGIHRGEPQVASHVLESPLLPESSP